MKGLLLLPCLLLGLILPVQANDTSDRPPATDSTLQPLLDELYRLLQAGRYEEAHQLALTHLAEQEGEPAFDYAYGLSALHTGRYQPALFSFERLAAGFPQVQRYRLELARSYFHLGNLQQAETEFRQVLATQPPAAVRQNIQRFLDQIQQQRQQLTPRWQNSLTLAGGYDSNTNSATSSEQIELYDGLLTATLRPEQRRSGSPFWQARAITSYLSPLSRHSAWDASAAISLKDNTDSHAYDLSSLNLQTGIRHVSGALQWRAGASAALHWLDGHTLQQDTGLSADLYWRWRPGLQPFARLQLNYLNSDLNDELDMLRPQLQGGLSWTAGPFSSQATLSYAQDHSLNDADFQARDILGLSLAAQYSHNRSDLYASLLWRDYHFQAAATDPVANGTTRAEQLAQALAGYRYRLSPGLSVYTQFSYLQNRSNLDVYEYHRALTEAGLTLAF